jgi:DUF177 domain-containing protein
MKVELKEIGEFPVEVSIFEDEKEIGFNIEGLRFVEGVNAHLSIQQTETEYYLNGICTAKVELVCSRCLEPAKESIAGELEIIAVRETGSVERFADVEDVIPLDDKEILEFSEQIRQSILGAMPPKPLCSPDCLGLCPSCGENRNINSCTCSNETTDSRWDSLKDLSE